MTMSDNRIKDYILKLLSKHIYGLTIEDISKQLKINRATASKYLYALSMEKRISVRIVGKAKLHYPRGVRIS